MNHTDVAINYFSINGYGGKNIVPFVVGVLLRYVAR